MKDCAMDATPLLFDAHSAVDAIKKNSKLRIHYLKLIVMNNIFRAFVFLYKLDSKYVQAQTELLRVLTQVEARKNRAWFNQDKEVLVHAYTLYCELMESISNEDLFTLMQTVEEHQDKGAYLVIKHK